MLKKIYTLLSIGTLIFFSQSLNAQQNFYNWRVGGNTGIVTYFGDLSYTFFKPSYVKFGYGAAGEWNFTKSSSFRFSYFAGEFSASDRQYQNNPNFDRAFNFNTHFQAIDLSYVYYTDNGKLFSERAFLSPYFFVGFGAMQFDVFADLFDENGQRYYYWQDGSIRNIDEASYTGTENLQELERSFTYETNVSELNLEKEGGYRNQTIYIPFGMGLKFRLGSRLNLNLETKINYTFTDYLDDVGNKPINPNLADPTAIYAADPNNNIGSGNRGGSRWNLNDAFIYTSASLFFNFGKRKDAFAGPVLHAANQPLKASEIDKKRTDEQAVSDSINQFIKEQNFALAEKATKELEEESTEETAVFKDTENEAIKALERKINEQQQEIEKLQNIIKNLTKTEIEKTQKSIEKDTTKLKTEPLKEDSLKVVEEKHEDLDEIEEEITETKSEPETTEEVKSEPKVEQSEEEDATIEEEDEKIEETSSEDTKEEDILISDAATFVGDEEVMEELEENVTQNYALLMKSDAINPDEEQKEVLESIYKKLQENQDYNLLIIGYNDPEQEGDDDATIKRVLNIRSFFTIDKKMPATRVYTQYSIYSADEVEDNFENIELKLVEE